MSLEIKIKRNEDLDIVRGFAMMWVILIHCLYWPGLFESGTAYTMKSLLLIEMPLFFFVAGASNAMGKKKALSNFYITRFKRILIPYWIYSLIIITISIIFSKINLQGVTKYFTIKPGGHYFELELPAILMPVSNVPYLTGALWFIPVYLCVIIFFPLFKRYFDECKTNSRKIIPLLIFAVCVFLFTFFHFLAVGDVVRNIFFYGFWTYLGLFFQELIKKRGIKEKANVIPIVIAFLVAISILLLRFYQFANMQNNKFPPNFIFLVYTFGALSVFYLLLNYIIAAINFLRKNGLFHWVFDQYIKNGYTIYLYHPFSFLIALIVSKFIGLRPFLLEHQWLCLFMYLMWIIPSSAILGKLFSWTETIGASRRHSKL